MTTPNDPAPTTGAAEQAKQMADSYGRIAKQKRAAGEIAEAQRWEDRAIGALGVWDVLTGRRTLPLAAPPARGEQAGFVQVCTCGRNSSVVDQACPTHGTKYHVTVTTFPATPPAPAEGPRQPQTGDQV